MENPFPLVPYKSAELFCDRVQETKSLISYLENGSNITLISPRRYGKTGLVLRTFEKLKRRACKCFYVDIFSSQNLEDFVKLLSEAVLSTLAGKSALKSFFDSLRAVRPLVSYDPISGSPQVSITYQFDDQKKQTLKSILDYLDSLGGKIVLAIDEFQQVREYPEKNVEALLRTYVQQTKNIRFIFCGSKKHVMSDMFTNAKNPFYESTSFLYLDKIDQNAYAEFIRNKFVKGGKVIDDSAINFVLEWTKRHTYYTQYLCNRVFAMDTDSVSVETVRVAAAQILQNEEQNILERRALLTERQWNFLKAVAKEGEVRQPTAAAFLQKYKIGNAANSNKIVKALVEKELLLETLSLEGKSYSVYNVFMSRWMESR